MSGVNGKGNLSYKKKNTSDSKLLTTGAKKIEFWTELSGGETSISFSSLSLPADILSSGFSNPLSSEILALNLGFNHTNLKVFSSLNGELMKGLTWAVSSSTLVFKGGYTGTSGEIIYFKFDGNIQNANQVVDAKPLAVSGTLTATTTDFNVGEVFKVNEFPSKQIGAVTVFRDGLQQFRCIGNDLNNAGDYVEVHTIGGYGTIIRFKTTSLVDNSILVKGTSGLVAEKPTISMMQIIETIQGQVDLMVPDLAIVTGNPETAYQGAANNVDLKNFSDTVVLLKSLYNVNTKVSEYTKTKYQEKSATQNANGVVTGVTYNNIVIGKTYRIMAKARIAGSGVARYSMTWNQLNLEGWNLIDSNGQGPHYTYTKLFVADTNTLTLTMSIVDPGGGVTFDLQLEEMANHEITVQWN